MTQISEPARIAMKSISSVTTKSCLPHRRVARPAAITLIELLVVIAIIGQITSL